MKRIGLLLVCFFAVHAEQEFTVQKKKKEPSANQLKEICCEQFGDILKTIPDLLQEVACVQTKSLSALQGFFESDKQSLCERMSKEQLAVCTKKQETVLAQIDILIDQLHELHTFLATIPSK